MEARDRRSSRGQWPGARLQPISRREVRHPRVCGRKFPRLRQPASSRRSNSVLSDLLWSSCLYAQGCEVLAGADHAASCAVNDFNDSFRRSHDNKSHLHRLQHHNSSPRLHALARLHCHLPHARGHWRTHRFTTFRNACGRGGRRFFRRFDKLRLAGGRPSLAFGQESGLLILLEYRRLRSDTPQEGVIVAQLEIGLLDLEPVLPTGKCLAHLEEFLGRNRKEANLIEETQQPWRAGLELRRTAVRIPHLNRAPYKLIASRAFHAVNAEVGSPDPDGVFRCPCARRVVLRGHQAVPRIQWRCDGRPKIYVAQSHHEITRVEHDVPYVFNRSEPVDAADELDVARTPRCIRPHRLHVLANSKLSRRIIPG